jgi:site-specific recombinase XerC
VTIAPFPAPPAGNPASGEIVTAAVDRYLDSIKTKTTRSSYAATLARLVSRAGGRDTASLLPEDYAAVMDRWDDAAAATWNRHLSALASFTAWAGRQEILTTSPARRLERRKPARRGDRAIPRARLDKLLAGDRHGLRERVLWRML